MPKFQPASLVTKEQAQEILAESRRRKGIGRREEEARKRREEEAKRREAARKRREERARLKRLEEAKRLEKQRKADQKRIQEIRRLQEQREALQQRGATGVITAAERKRGLDRLDERIRKKRRGLIGKDTIKAQATGAGLGFASAILGTARFGKAAVTKPVQTAKAIPAGLKAAGKTITSGQLARVLREEPGFVTGAVAGEVLVTKGGQVAVVKGGRATGAVATRLTPGFKRVRKIKTKAGVERVIRGLKKIGGKGELRIIPAGKGGPRKIKGKPTLPSIRGGFKFTKKEQKAIVKEKGKGPTVSAAKGLFGPIRRKVKVKPGTEKKELAFFGTPPVKGIGFIRESRLGLGQKAGRFRDLITGEATVGKVKPQIIVVKESKGFKGTGFKSTELETTLKPGLILKKTGKAGTTVLGKGLGQRVPIITAKVVKPSKETSRLFNKAAKGVKLTAKQKAKIKKATGFTAKEISQSFVPKRRISPAALSAQIARIRERRTKVGKRSVPAKRLPRPKIKPRRPTPPRRPIPPRRPTPRPGPRPSPPRPRPTPRPTPRPKPRPPTRPPTRPPARPPIRPPIRRPPTAPPKLPIQIQEALKRIKKKKRKATRSDIALVEGFTARILGLKPVKITKKNLQSKIKQFQTIKLRRRPVFVKTKKRR